jgi:hypothetical protein
MHLVFLNQYYPPDAAPTGVMLAAVAKQLVEDGHEVTVLCASGGYAVATGSAKCEGTSEKRPGEAPGRERREPAARVIRIGATRFGRGTFAGKLADYASYYAGVKWKLMTLRPRPDRVVALTTPPYLSILARMFSKLRGGDHAHWVMDLYPDVMVAHGMLKQKSPLHRLLARLTRFGFGGKRCAAVLTLGPDMAGRVGKHCAVPARSVEAVPLWGGVKSDRWKGIRGRGGGVPSDQCRVISGRSGMGEGRCALDGGVARGGPVAAEEGRDEDAVMALRRARGWGDDELVVMYSGNMGLGHRFGEILEAAEAFGIDHGGRPAIRFAFYGGGKRRGEIEGFLRNHPAAPVELHDYAPAETLAAHLQSADVHLASLAAEWTGTMVPSKLQGVFGVGRPVVFIGSAESSLGRWVRESGGGWQVEPGDVDGLRTALEGAANSGERHRRGGLAAAFAREHFDRETNVREIAGILTRPRC